MRPYTKNLGQGVEQSHPYMNVSYHYNSFSQMMQFTLSLVWRLPQLAQLASDKTVTKLPGFSSSRICFTMSKFLIQVCMIVQIENGSFISH